ncbi:hypothetical protein ACJX0J_009136, partial [Zea mays]
MASILSGMGRFYMFLIFLVFSGWGHMLKYFFAHGMIVSSNMLEIPLLVLMHMDNYLPVHLHNHHLPGPDVSHELGLAINDISHEARVRYESTLHVVDLILWFLAT